MAAGAGLLGQSRGLGLGRLADIRLGLVHLGQLGDEPGLELRPELDEQLLGGLGEVLGGPGEDVERLGLVGRGGVGGGPGQALLGPLHGSPGPDQVFLEGHAGVAQAGRGGRERLGGPAGLELPGLVLAEFGPGEVALRRGGAGVEPLQLFPEHRLGLLLGGDGPGQVIAIATEVGRGVGQVRLGLAQLRRLEVGEHGIGGEGRGGLADGRLAIAQCRLCRLAIAGLLRGEGPGVVHHFLLVAGQRLEVGTAGGQLLLGLALIHGESRPTQLAPLVLDDPLELAQRLAHLPQASELELEVEVLGEQDVAEVLELGEELADFGLRLGKLGFLEHLVRVAHLLEDQLFAGELEGEPEPRGVLRLETAEGLGEAEHALFQLRHLGRGVFLGEADFIPVGGAARGGLGRCLVLGGRLLVVERGFRLVGLRSRRCLGRRPPGREGRDTASRTARQDRPLGIGHAG